jgi:hypothetical protein
MEQMTIPSYPNYAARRNGDIVRIRRGNHTRPGKVLRPYAHPHGYRGVVMYSGNHSSRETVHVHRLVAEAFLGACPVGFQVNHKDGNKANNAADNLEYVTPRENTLHADRLGHRRVKGENHHLCKLSEQDVRDIRSRVGEPARDVARLYGIDRKSVTNIWSSKTWKHVA